MALFLSLTLSPSHVAFALRALQPDQDPKTVRVISAGLEEWNSEELIQKLQYSPKELERLSDQWFNTTFVVTADEIRRLAASFPFDPSTTSEAVRSLVLFEELPSKDIRN